MIYLKYSTDAGAPTLSGTAGALIGVLDHCLVTTAGWTKSFTGTNVASYRAPAGNRFYLNVDDTGTTVARVRAFEIATAASVAVPTGGTMPFPTETQFSGGLYTAKSDAASGASRNWWFFGNDRLFYLIMQAGTSSSTTTTLAFGDISSLKSSDAFATIILGQNTNSTNGLSGKTLGYSPSSAPLSAAGLSDSYTARGHTQLGGSIANAHFSFGAVHAGNTDSFATTLVPMPTPCSSSFHLYRKFILDPLIDFRGTLPGVWFGAHNKSLFPHGGVFTVTVSGATRSFIVLHNYSNGAFCMETSDTWYS